MSPASMICQNQRGTTIFLKKNKKGSFSTNSTPLNLILDNSALSVLYFIIYHAILDNITRVNFEENGTKGQNSAVQFSQSRRDSTPYLHDLLLFTEILRLHSA